MEQSKSFHRGKQDQKKAYLRLSGGGGVAGVIVWGGALVIAGLLAAFTAQKTRRRHAHKSPAVAPPPSDDCSHKLDGENGLRFIVQTPPPTLNHHQCSARENEATQIDSCQLIYKKDLILEEKSSSMVGGRDERSTCDTQKETVFLSDESKQESSELCADSVISNEVQRPMVDNLPVSEAQAVIKDERKKDVQVTGEKEENNTVDAVMEENFPLQSDGKEEGEQAEERNHDDGDENVEDVLKTMGVEENSSLQPASDQEDEDEDECNEDHDYVNEKGEESSDGTWSSSMESNVEAIWPAEMIEALSLELKQLKNNNLISGMKIEDDNQVSREGQCYLDNHNSNNDGKIFNNGYAGDEHKENSTVSLNKDELQWFTMATEQKPLSKRRIWIWSVFLVALVLLLLLHRTADIFLLS